jgi:hypothetical protein
MNAIAQRRIPPPNMQVNTRPSDAENLGINRKADPIIAANVQR